MPGGWNGAGQVLNYDGTHVPSDNQCSQQTAPDQTAFDTMFTTVCNAIENCVARDGQNSPSANLPMNSKKLTGLTTGSALTDSVSATQVVNSTLLWGGTSTGSANTHAISVTIAPSAYVAGQRFAFLAGYTNSGITTLNVNSLGAKTIKAFPAADLAAGEVRAGCVQDVIYDGTNFILLTQNTWTINLQLVPAADLTQYIGDSTHRVASIYTQGIQDGTGVESPVGAGTTQGTATAISKQFVNATGANDSGLILPATTIVGREIYISNSNAGAAWLKIYPESGGSIWPRSTNDYVYLHEQSGGLFKCVSASNWIVINNAQV